MERQVQRMGTVRNRKRTLPGIAGLLALLLAVPLLWAGLGGAPARAQIAGFGDQPEIPDVLATFDVRMEPAVAHPGEHVRLLITADIADGWYTYSVVEQGEFAPPPTKLTLQPGPLAPEGPVYETNPTVKEDKVFGIPLAFHPNAARFYRNFRVPEDATSGDLTVQGTLRYQVCNNTYCTPPRNEPIAAGLTIEQGPVRPAFAYMERTIHYIDGQGNVALNADTLQGALAGGLGGFVLLAVGFGLLSLLTPCVFPMIPVTVSFFTSASDGGRRNTLRLAVLFGLGMIVTYTGLGLALTFFMGATGVTQFATNPWVNLAVAGFFVFFALSLMGLYEFSLPGGLVNRLNRSAVDIKGPVGVLAMGVAFTATSFTCTVPFVGTLLVAATQGQVFWPVVGMLIFSTVFALPFFLLALFPRYLLALRGRSGNWLVQVKVVLGLVELIAALKFVSNADLVLQWGIFDRHVVLGLSAVVVAVAALIVLGLLPWPGVSVTRRGAPRLALGAALLALAVYLGAGLTGRELDSYTEAYLPPAAEGRLAVAATLADGDYVPAQAVHDLPWQQTLAAGLERARAEGKPVFIDFTGYTCINCRWMEKKVFAEKSVYNRFRDDFVLVQLYTDGGEHAEANQRLQVERFRTLALPFYVILSPDNTVLARHAGIVPTPADFLAFLNDGRRGNEAVAAAAR